MNNIDILEEIINYNYVKLLNALAVNGKDLNCFLSDGKLPIEKAID